MPKPSNVKPGRFINCVNTEHEKSNSAELTAASESTECFYE